MSTSSQIAANQANAQLSTGPRTGQGKSVASRNATKHGFTGKSILLPGENPQEFESLLHE